MSLHSAICRGRGGPWVGIQKRTRNWDPVHRSVNVNTCSTNLRAIEGLGLQAWGLLLWANGLDYWSWVSRPGSWVLGPGSWVLGPGSLVLGPGSWVLGAVVWNLGPGVWGLDLWPQNVVLRHQGCVRCESPCFMCHTLLLSSNFRCGTASPAKVPSSSLGIWSWPMGSLGLLWVWSCLYQAPIVASVKMYRAMQIPQTFPVLLQPTYIIVLWSAMQYIQEWSRLAHCLWGWK